MADIDASVTIATAGADVVLDCGPLFTLVAVGAGGVTWRRYTVEGRYQHGRALLGAVLEQGNLSVVVRIKGADWVAVQNAYGVLAAALSQFSYEVTVSLDGHALTYVCEPGDIRMTAGDTVDKFGLHNGRQEYELTIPFDPSTVVAA